MTERSYKQTKTALALLLGGAVAIMNISGIGYVEVGEHVYIDLSMIPAATILIICGYRTGLTFGLLWGLLSCFTHPLAAYDSYLMTMLSQVVFAISIVGARKIGYRFRGACNAMHAVFFAIVMHSLVFDVGVFSFLASTKWHAEIPIGQIIVKVVLTIMFFYMTIELVTKQLHQLHLANRVKRSQL